MEGIMAATRVMQLLEDLGSTQNGTALRESWMLNGFPVHRAARRVAMHLPVTITAAGGGPTHLGLTRDLSRCGLFVFSKFFPQAGTEVDITLRLPPVLALDRIALKCRGRVVRADQVTEGAAVGIAVQVEHLEVVSLVSEEAGERN
jgi:hypothetical protein